MEGGGAPTSAVPGAMPTPDPQSGDWPGLSTENRLRLEELADKLLDKKEKFAYFLITAMTFIIAFTFNDFNAKGGVLKHAPLWLTGTGWGALISSSLLPLYVIRARHHTYTLNLRILESGRTRANPDEAAEFRRVAARAQLAELAGTALFVAGVAVLASAYVVGLSRTP
jgi:hypothetical protein